MHKTNSQATKEWQEQQRLKALQRKERTIPRESIENKKETDDSKDGYVKVPYVWGKIGLSPTERLILADIANFAAMQGGNTVHLKTESIAKRLGIGRRNVCYVLDHLVSKGYIKKGREKYATVFEIDFEKINEDIKNINND